MLFSFFSVNFQDLYPLFSSKEIPFLQGITDLFNGVTLYPASRALAAKCHRLLKDVPRELDLDHRGQLLRIAAAILSFEFKNAQPGRSQSIPMDGRMSQIFDKLSTAEIRFWDDICRRVKEEHPQLNRPCNHATRSSDGQVGIGREAWPSPYSTWTSGFYIYGIGFEHLCSGDEQAPWAGIWVEWW